VKNLSVVSLTQVNSLLPVSFTVHQCHRYQSEISKKPKIYRRCQQHRQKKLFTGVDNTVDKFFAGVNDTPDKTELTIPACLDLKMKNKKKFNLQV
jgi:hypothetical protein